MTNHPNQEASIPVQLDQQNTSDTEQETNPILPIDPVFLDPILTWFTGSPPKEDEREPPPTKTEIQQIFKQLGFGSSSSSSGGGWLDNVGDFFSDMGSSIVDGLEAADRWVQGSGDDCDWMHGFRLTATTDDAAYNGSAIRGHAEEFIYDVGNF